MYDASGRFSRNKSGPRHRRARQRRSRAGADDDGELLGRHRLGHFADHVSRSKRSLLLSAASGRSPDPVGRRRGFGQPLAGRDQTARRILALRRTIRRIQPHTIISFTSNVNIETLIATRGLGIPVIVSERVDPAMMPIDNWLRRQIQRAVLPQARTIVMQTERAKDCLTARARRRAVVIGNPVAPVSGRTVDVATDEIGLARPSILAMGRLVEQKGFDLLIEAFARVHADYPLWTLTIIGGGPLLESLQQLCRRLKIDRFVRFAGRVTAPDEWLRQGDLFVLPSRFEGFPNALCEAMACGLPAIAADCRSGPRELIRPGIDGILVPPNDVAALAAALHRLMGDATLRHELGSRATEIVDRFSLARIMGKWESLLAEASGSRETALPASTSDECQRQAA